MRKAIEALQPLGRALMLPIAVLPVAAMLLRLGQPDLLNISFISAAGDAIFAHLGLLFAVGVATGFARDGNGAAALAGMICYFIAQNGAATFIMVPPEAIAEATGDAIAIVEKAFRTGALAKLDVPIGIISGMIGGIFYNRFATIKLPDYLAFFGGRRFVPIAAGLAGLGLALALGLSYHEINAAMDTASRAIIDAGSIGLFIFGVLNRLLLVTGLHHIINNLAWFVFGDYQGITGDLRRFFAGDPTAGAFMAGFFPIMMFGLPAACLAMYHEARSENRKVVAGLMISLGLTSFLTGVTEPIEYCFIFLAPMLYAIHAVLTGISMVVMDALDVRMGFGFSAGFIDYVLGYGKATRPLFLLPIGLIYAAIYYALFRVTIRHFDLKTPGREASDAAEAALASNGVASPGATSPEATSPEAASQGARARAFIAALGGAANLAQVDACTTRLRLNLVDGGLIDEAALKALGARGVVKASDKAIQVVLGPMADAVAMEMRANLGAGALSGLSVSEGDGAPTAPDDGDAISPELVRALGGAANIISQQSLDGRWRVALIDSKAVSATKVTEAGARSVVILGNNIAHILKSVDG